MGCHTVKEPGCNVTGSTWVSLELESRRADPFMVVAVTGDLELDTAEVLERHVEGRLGEGERRIVLDLSRVDFCDSSGLRVFVKLHRQVADQGGVLRLAGPAVTVRTVLELSGLDSYLSIYDTVGAATGEPAG